MGVSMNFSVKGGDWVCHSRPVACHGLSPATAPFDARRKLAMWRHDYNHHRPHSALADRTPNEFATTHSRGKDGDQAALENAPRFPLSLRTAAAGFFLKGDQSSSLLLETLT